MWSIVKEIGKILAGVHGGLSASLWTKGFNSQSMHMPGLWARSPVGGVQETTYTLMFLSLSSPLSKNKILVVGGRNNKELKQ